MRAFSAATRAAVTLIVVVGCLGCGPRLRPENWVLPPTVVVSTPGVRIEAPDGSWALTPDEPTAAPFYSYDCPMKPTPDNLRLGQRIGGQPVIVHHPEHDRPLHGILALCRIHRTVRGPVTEAYNIQVPRSYVRATSDGRTSVVFEPSGKEVEYHGKHDLPAWVLWLKREPL